jgi:hypothetical protein
MMERVCSRVRWLGVGQALLGALRCDNQDLIMHTTMSDGVATVRQTVFSCCWGE